jgi:hypothetical protein
MVTFGPVLTEVVYATAFANEAGVAINFVAPGTYDTRARITRRPGAVLSRMAFDLAALLSIVVISIITFEQMNQNVTNTMILTTVTLIFAFLLPVVIIQPLIEHVCKGCGNWAKVGLSVGVIAALYGLERMTRGLIIYLAGWKTVVVDAEELLAGINDDG